MGLGTPFQPSPNGHMLKKALSIEKYCLRTYSQALAQAKNTGDSAIWERLIAETQQHIEFIAQSLQVNYGGG